MSGAQRRPGFMCTAIIDFMRASMVSAVEVAGRGIATRLNSWRGRVRCFDDVDVELVTLVQGPADSVVMSTKSSVTIAALRVFAPAQHRRKRSIAGRILGQRIVLYGSVRFGWDGDCGCVTSTLVQSDMLTPMWGFYR